MKESFANLVKFIQDFNLKKPDGSIWFNARLEFDNTIKIKESEVHIITSDNLVVIYFLSLEINDALLPEMFDLKNSSFTYFEMQCLKIETKDCVVSVFPV